MEETGMKVYRGKRVLVTGHTGFKGTWLTLWLRMLGAEVLGYALDPPTSPSLFDLLGLDESITHVVADVRDKGRLAAAVSEFQPEIVFHLAAQPLVRLSYQQPRLTYETNIMGTVNLYEAVRKVGSVRAVVTVTSDKCYENREWVYGYRETDPMGGYDPYSSSKACVELVTYAYRRSFLQEKGIAVATARAGNVIGGGDWGENRLIPDCVRALAGGRPIVLRNPGAVRPWQYVLEPLAGYLWLGIWLLRDTAGYSGAWNFGPEGDDLLTVEEVVKLLLEHWDGGEYTVDATRQPYEAGMLRLDTGKARCLLKWAPVYGIREALERTAAWYRMFYNDGAQKVGRDYTIKEIEDYVRAARRRGVAWATEA